MNISSFNFILFLSIFLITCKSNQNNNSDTQEINTKTPFSPNKNMIAVIHTSKGIIEVGLEYVRTPLTVANFVALAEGTMPNNHRAIGKPFYDGLKFHRVVSNFMIQGGDPNGNGAGGAGYNFVDEFSDELTHDDAGVLSMANSGPNSNSSQFFITHNSTPWLDGVHTIFGKVIKGMDVVNSIQINDVIDSIRIHRKTQDAKDFNAYKIFESQKIIIQQKIKASMIEKFIGLQNSTTYKFFEEYVKKAFPNAEKTNSGLYFYKVSTTENQQAQANNTVKVHYKGMLTNGKIFDQSYGKPPFVFKLGQGQVIQGWDEGIALLKKGEKAILCIPSYLAYGENGVQGAIAPNEPLIFEVELLDIIN